MSGKGVLILGCIAAAIAAQDSAPASRPESRPAVELVIEHGIKVRIVPVDLPGEIAILVAMEGAGILSEPKGAPHLAHVSEHVAFYCAGRSDLSTKWFAEGRANAETLPELMYFDTYPKEGELKDALLLALGRAIGFGLIDDAVLQREKPVALAEVRQAEANGTKKIDFLGKFAWSGFVQVAAFGAKDVPFVTYTEGIEQDAVQRFCGPSRFRPDRASIVVVGDVDPLTVEDTLATFAEKVKMEVRAAPIGPIAIKPGAFQASWDVKSHQFFMAWPGPPPADPSHAALTLLGAALRAKLPMTPALAALAAQPIAVHSALDGLFVIQMPLRSGASGDPASVEVRKVLEGIAGDPLFRSASRLVRQEAGLGRISYPPHLPRKIMAHVNQELMRLRAALAWKQSPEDYLTRVHQVTAADVSAAIKTWLAPEKATVVTITGKE